MGVAAARADVAASAASQNCVSAPAVVAGRLDGGGVHGARNAHPAGAQPPGHLLLRGRGPGIVVLTVDDQHRDLAQPGQLGRPVRGGEQVPGHRHQPDRVVALHPPRQECEDLSGDVGRDSLRLQVRVPELGDTGRERRPVRHAAVPDAEGVEHRAQLGGPRPGERARSRAHQRQGHDIAAEGQAAAGEPCAGQHGLTGHQPAVGVPDQVPGARGVDDRGDVGAKRGRGVAVRVVRAGCLELPAHVDRDHLTASVGQQVEDREEVFLAAGIARDEQGGVPLADPRGRRGLERRERRPGWS